MHDTAHLIAIRERIFRETERLAAATTEPEREFRARQIESAKREEESELQFLRDRGVELYDTPDNRDDDDILRELFE